MHLAGAVGGEYDEGRNTGPDLTEFRDCHGVLVEDLQQECLELVVGAVDFVDEKHARSVGEGLQQWAGEQESFGVEGTFGGIGVETARACGFECAQVQQLPGKIPVVQRL